MPTLQERQQQEKELEELAIQEEKESNNFIAFFNKILNKTKEKEITISKEHLSCTFNAFGHLKLVKLLVANTAVQTLVEEAEQIVKEYHLHLNKIGKKVQLTIGETINKKTRLLSDSIKKTKDQDEIKIKTFIDISSKLLVKERDHKNIVSTEINLAFQDFHVSVLKSDIDANQFIDGFALSYFELSKTIYDYSTKIFTIFADDNSTEEAINNLLYQQNNQSLNIKNYNINIKEEIL